MVRMRSPVRPRVSAPDKMAKSARIFIRLKCSECGTINYTTSRNKNATEKLELKKFCKKERKYTLHKEVKI